ncbi:MAG: hypothetical protein V4819_00755 [Verrucomicrobiota bacterium]
MERDPVSQPTKSRGRSGLEGNPKEVLAAVESDGTATPSAGASKFLSLIRRLPTLGSSDFFKLAQQSAGGAALQNAVLNEWAKRHPKEMFETIERMYNSKDDPRGEWANLAVIQWMEQNPGEAIRSLDAIPTSMGRGGYDSHPTAIAAAKRSGNYALALDLEIKWPNNVYHGDPPGEFEKWYPRNTAIALEKISKIGNSGLRGTYIERIGKIAAGGTQEQIIATASSFSSVDRLAFMKGVVGEMAKQSPEEAVRFLSENFNDANSLKAVEPAILLWATKDPAAAIGWSEEHLHGEARKKAVSGAIRQVIQVDKQLAANLVMEMTPGSIRNESASELLEGFLDPAESASAPQLTEWITSFPDAAARNYMLDQNWSKLSRSSLALAKTLCASEDPEIASNERISTLATSLYANEPESFETWTRSLPDRNRKIAQAAVK